VAIETDVRPKKATVRLDGEEIGQARDYNGTWNYLWLEPGEHVLEFEYPGHMSLRVDIDLGAGEYRRIVDRLQKGEGLDPRSSPARDRAPRQRAPREDPTPRGEGHRIVERPRHLTTQMRKGFLRFRIEPGDAAVYLDGEFLAAAGELARLHGAVPVAPGEHLVEAARPGLPSRSVIVIVEAGEAAIAELDLRESMREREAPDLEPDQ
jgi:hypothetical protein